MFDLHTSSPVGGAGQHEGSFLPLGVGVHGPLSGHRGPPRIRGSGTTKEVCSCFQAYQRYDSTIQTFSPRAVWNLRHTLVRSLNPARVFSALSWNSFESIRPCFVICVLAPHFACECLLFLLLLLFHHMNV
jgi:hypothetical protein